MKVEWVKRGEAVGAEKLVTDGWRGELTRGSSQSPETGCRGCEADLVFVGGCVGQAVGLAGLVAGEGRETMVGRRRLILRRRCLEPRGGL
ncbi:hypothetical protein OIU78_029638 [Salix suchowensis]|nr:hypothetical protein OIU78_029638 [Salix suchowensis]